MESRIETLRGILPEDRTAYEELEFRALSKGLESTYPNRRDLAPLQFTAPDRRASKGAKARANAPVDGKRRRADGPDVVTGVVENRDERTSANARDARADGPETERNNQRGTVEQQNRGTTDSTQRGIGASDPRPQDGRGNQLSGDDNGRTQR